MTERPIRNLTASVRQRLQNYASRTEQDFQIVLSRYGFERLLYRLEQSPYKGQFTLKGALMFLVWGGDPFRPTRDMDFTTLLMRTAPELKSIFREICAVSVPDDGLLLSESSVEVEPIRDEDDYGGMRVTLTAMLGQARIPLQIDIGFGDAVTPPPVTEAFPASLRKKQ